MFKSQPCKFLWSYLRLHNKRLWVAFIALLAAASLVLLIGRGLRYVVDQELINKIHLIKILSIFFIMVALLAAASFGRVYFVNWLGEKVINNIRQDLFNRILKFDFIFFETTRAGELVSCLTTDMHLIQIVLCNSAAIAMRNIMLVIGGIAMMLCTSLKLSFITFVAVPIIIMPIIFFGKKVKQLSKEAQNNIAHMGGYIDETFNNMKTVQVFNHEIIDQLSFQNLSQKLFKTSMESTRARAWLTFFVMLWVFLAIAIVFAIGVNSVISLEITSGDLSSFMFFAVLVATALGSFSGTVGDLQKANGALEHVIDLFNHPLPSEFITYRPLPSQLKGIVALHKVDFAYPSNPNYKVLNEINLSIAPGETVAIVGPSGVGKSTIFSLLLKLYEPNKGKIYIDGINIQDFNTQQLRSYVGLVPQDPVLFSNTIFENILYGRPTATEDEVWQATKIASLDEFLKTLPQGIHTNIGNLGIRISGGQKQRIAIARAVLRNPSILLLDEATSSLDAEIELAVQDSLQNLAGSCTIIIIAHRLITAQRANRIIVLNHGKVEETGSHDLLISKGGLYSRLAALQFTEN